MKTIKLVSFILFFYSSYSFAQFGIGTASTNPSAQLEVVATDKGVLIPQIALSSDTDATTIINGNIESLLIYNTNTSSGLSLGYYYWNNAKWNKLATTDGTHISKAAVSSSNGSISGTATDAVFTAMDLEVKVDNSTLEVDVTNGVQVKDEGIITSKIADNAVDGTKIQVTGETQGSMLYNNGTDWVDFPIGTAEQFLKMNTAGTAPEWVTPISKRIGEFVYAKSGKTEANGYLPVTPGTIVNGATTYPLWAVQYPEFVSGNDIVFPTDVDGMFLRNVGGNAASEGLAQDAATAMPTTPFSTGSSGSHVHTVSNALSNLAYSSDEGGDGTLSTMTDDQNQGSINKFRHNHSVTGGAHSHSITSGGDAETRPGNRSYQLYTIVDTY
ncbi:MAG: hypothetical protein JKX82_00125 [Oleispira sp.]|nr:hypothetical protein [Oleispira sp.]